MQLVTCNSQRAIKGGWAACGLGDVAADEVPVAHVDARVRREEGVLSEGRVERPPAGAEAAAEAAAECEPAPRLYVTRHKLRVAHSRAGGSARVGRGDRLAACLLVGA